MTVRELAEYLEESLTLGTLKGNEEVVDHAMFPLDGMEIIGLFEGNIVKLTSSEYEVAQGLLEEEELEEYEDAW